jgi:hypothetical protein
MVSVGAAYQGHLPIFLMVGPFTDWWSLQVSRSHETEATNEMHPQNDSPRSYAFTSL